MIRRVATAIWDRQRKAVQQRSPDSLSATTEFGGTALPVEFWEELEADAEAAVDAMDEITVMAELTRELDAVEAKALDLTISTEPIIPTGITDEEARRLVLGSVATIREKMNGGLGQP